MVSACDFKTKIATCFGFTTTTTTDIATLTTPTTTFKSTTTTIDPSVIIGSNGVCSWTINYLNCEDFTHLDELSLDESLNLKAFTFTQLRLAPLNKILFESDTDAFKYVTLSPDCEITLENFGGFRAIGNPFTGASRSKLTLTDSIFVFYAEGDKPLDEQECDSINRNDIYVTIFDGCQYLKLTSSVVYSQKFCPALLKGAQMNIFEIEGVSDSIANKNFTVLDLDSV